MSGRDTRGTLRRARSTPGKRWRGHISDGSGYQITPIVISEDLSRPGAAARIYEAVKARGLEVSFLVNNAGFGSTGAFLDLPLEKELEMMQLNCATLLELSHRFGQDMRTRKSGRKK